MYTAVYFFVAGLMSRYSRNVITEDCRVLGIPNDAKVDTITWCKFATRYAQCPKT